MILFQKKTAKRKGLSITSSGTSVPIIKDSTIAIEVKKEIEKTNTPIDKST